MAHYRIMTYASYTSPPPPPPLHQGKEPIHIQHKCDTIFRMIFNMVHNGQKKTPVHVCLSETVHDACRSKEPVQLMNRVGLSRSYDKVKWVDSALAQRTFEKTSVHRVPVPSSIQSNDLIQGAMDNFDHDETTKSGTGGSHDMILMLFQNAAHEMGEKPKEVSSKPLAEFERKALDRVFDCPKLVHVAKIWW